MDKKIEVSFILEMMGRPPKHLEESLNALIKQLDDEKGVRILNSSVNKPQKIKREKKSEKENVLYTTFAEVEAEFENMESLLMVVFKYMPSNVEVTSPENFVLKNNYISELLTSIILRLHKYDEITKKLINDRVLMVQKIRELQKNQEKN
jgi:hypothetical protein